MVLLLSSGRTRGVCSALSLEWRDLEGDGVKARLGAVSRRGGQDLGEPLIEEIDLLELASVQQADHSRPPEIAPRTVHDCVPAVDGTLEVAARDARHRSDQRSERVTLGSLREVIDERHVVTGEIVYRLARPAPDPRLDSSDEPHPEQDADVMVERIRRPAENGSDGRHRRRSDDLQRVDDLLPRGSCAFPDIRQLLQTPLGWNDY
jgi:hypothetical protein